MFSSSKSNDRFKDDNLYQIFIFMSIIFMGAIKMALVIFLAPDFSLLLARILGQWEFVGALKTKRDRLA
jgi:hypothetical protein